MTWFGTLAAQQKCRNESMFTKTWLVHSQPTQIDCGWWYFLLSGFYLSTIRINLCKTIIASICIINFFADHFSFFTAFQSWTIFWYWLIRSLLSFVGKTYSIRIRLKTDQSPFISHILMEIRDIRWGVIEATDGSFICCSHMSHVRPSGWLKQIVHEIVV